MKLSLYIPTGTTQEFAAYTDPVAAFDTIRELAAVADGSGFETIWAPDHFVPFGPPGAYVFEVWTTLAALARETSRIRLGQLVTGNGYRNPALLAKMASTLDVISGGRLTFGIGAGWYEEEYRAFGYDFPHAPERLRRLDEALQIITSMRTGQPTTFDGKYFQVRDVVNQPAGIQRPHVPMMIAGGGEKVTLKLVAKYGDLCNIQEPPSEVARKLDILAGHCEAVGRDYSTITKTSTSYCIIADTDEEARATVPPWAPMVFPGDLAEYGLVGTPDTIRGRLAVYEEAGVDELIVGFHDGLNPETLKLFAAEFIDR
ncbi:LLM class F420-dependent oxidoreductase [Nonomuraea sp. 3-1Str]|uniref:LLM class F420-dependent oxidoreductase n=1 Tax=Nonomuraea sp. 3-1Str TaxID=2929801 RepID=UPI00286460DB|nr:LLM class F420-dependent oxidoreductase [Nonomuraea sp. 3-1Str]MDR8407383.1 LLM class F420-dependent oxidoreductase [Nonomuraea sp. 3-1Str]